VKVARLEAGRAALLIVDIQEAFRGVIPGADAIIARAQILARAATLLELPIIVSEQYPKGLGTTVPELGEALAGALVLKKTTFSAAHAEGFSLAGRDQVIVCGTETHICVAQTVLDLLAADAEVWLACDALGSRSADDRALAIQRLALAGAVPSSTESICFELMKDAKNPHFKEIQGLIK
jgi:nicotinamidase-related amidase